MKKSSNNPLIRQKTLGFLAAALLLATTLHSQQPPTGKGATPEVDAPELVILGTLQDGGSPHMGCSKQCCAPLLKAPDPSRKVVSLGVLEPGLEKTYLFEATPDLPTQMAYLNDVAPFKAGPAPDGIFLTHAHIGHYAGLMFLGREAMNAAGVRVYTMPRMTKFLSSNGPWDQLVRLQNIQLQPVGENEGVRLSPRLKVTPIKVPHRDEYSETVGFEIAGPEKRILFIPDIDKWERWNESLVEILAGVDLAFLDATFFDAAEIGYRDMSEIPHPFVVETMELLKALPTSLKSKVYFIHLNHTNPLLDPESPAAQKVLASGFRIARFGDRFKL